MQIKSRIVNKTLYILLSGELDEYTAQTVRKNLDTLLDTEKGFIIRKRDIPIIHLNSFLYYTWINIQ